MTELRFGGRVERQALLRLTKVKKLWRAAIAYVSKGLNIQKKIKKMFVMIMEPIIIDEKYRSCNRIYVLRWVYNFF